MGDWIKDIIAGLLNAVVNALTTATPAASVPARQTMFLVAILSSHAESHQPTDRAEQSL